MLPTLNPTQCRMARAGLGLTAQELAEAAGLKRLTVARFETGRSIGDESRAKIEAALAEKGAEFSRRLSGRVGVSVPE